MTVHSAQPTQVFPGAEWTVADPADHGLDAEALRLAADEVSRIESRYGFVVIKNGVVVHETYYQGDANSRYHIFSITKGFGATVTGIAQTQGYLDVHDKVTDWLPVHHPDIRPDATIEHILAMTAAADPGDGSYHYTSGPILNSLPNIWWLATGRSPAQYYAEELAAPLGLTLHWPSTPKGWMQIGSRGPMPVLESTHRDLARLGLLWLRKGNWAGRQILSESFVEAALTPTFPEANMAYGYLWWLNREGRWVDSATPPRAYDGRRLPGAPENVFMALGARGKYMIVVPDEDLIVVSMGHTEGESGHSHPVVSLWEAISKLL